MEGKLSFKTGGPKFKSFYTIYKLGDLSKLTWLPPPICHICTISAHRTIGVGLD